MAKGCSTVRAWMTDVTVPGDHNLAPVSCDQYIAALEEALRAVTLTRENSNQFRYDPVRSVRRKLGIEEGELWGDISTPVLSTPAA